MEVAPLTPPASPLHTTTSPLEQPSTPTHQKIPNPLLHPPGAPRKPRTLLRWVQRSPQDSLDLREYFLGLPVAHDLDFKPSTPTFGHFSSSGDDEYSSFGNLLPAFNGPLFTTPFVTDYRCKGGKKRSLADQEEVEGKKRRLDGTPSFSISCKASLLQLEDAPQGACPAPPSTPSPLAKPFASPTLGPTATTLPCVNEAVIR